MNFEIVKAYWYSIYDGYTTKENKNTPASEIAYFMKVKDGTETLWFKLGNEVSENWYVTEE